MLDVILSEGAGVGHYWQANFSVLRFLAVGLIENCIYV